MAGSGTEDDYDKRGRTLISEDSRRYSDEDFALILREAAELASKSGSSRGGTSGGLTLTEIKSAAAEAGFDPTLVERAARLLPSSPAPSLLAQLIGGPVRYECEAHFSVQLDDDRSKLLLAAIRANAGRPGAGESSDVGVSWHSGGTEALNVAAHTEAGGTRVTANIDRSGGLVLGGMLTFFSLFLTIMFAAFGLQSAIGVAVAGVGVLAIARSLWKSSTKGVRLRMASLMETIDRTLQPPGESSSSSQRLLAGDNETEPGPEPE